MQIIGTLNNIFTYGENYGFKLYSLDSTEFKIIWKMYHSNVTLILVEKLEAIDENIYFHKLDLLFDALVFLYGLEDLINIQSVEKFKREIKVCLKFTISTSNPSISIFIHENSIQIGSISLDRCHS